MTSNRNRGRVEGNSDLGASDRDYMVVLNHYWAIVDGYIRSETRFLQQKLVSGLLFGRRAQFILTNKPWKIATPKMSESIVIFGKR